MTTHYAKYIRPRLDTDPEFRERYMKQRVAIYVKKMQNDPEYKMRQETRNKTRQRQRYDEDPAYREHKKQQALERYYKKRSLKSAELS